MVQLLGSLLALQVTTSNETQQGVVVVDHAQTAQEELSHFAEQQADEGGVAGGLPVPLRSSLLQRRAGAFEAELTETAV
jgi:hypothetical protein